MYVVCIGVPMSPQNIQSFVDMYHDYSSAVLITWDMPEDDSRVDYYQYLVIRGNTTIVAINISNTSVAISAVPYNENITFSVLAGNCVGESAEESEMINIGILGHNMQNCVNFSTWMVSS